jgi:hypothetical protein
MAYRAASIWCVSNSDNMCPVFVILSKLSAIVYKLNSLKPIFLIFWGIARRFCRVKEKLWIVFLELNWHHRQLETMVT